MIAAGVVVVGVLVLVAVAVFAWAAGFGGSDGRRSLPRRERSWGVDCRRRLCILGRFKAMSFCTEDKRCNTSKRSICSVSPSEYRML